MRSPSEGGVLGCVYQFHHINMEWGCQSLEPNCYNSGVLGCMAFGMAATNCYYKGIDVKNLSRLLGHADVNITYNLCIQLYGDGFDEMYEALVGNG